jgi:hypothetical protein
MITRKAHGQACHKNSGDPIFTEDFGVALNTAVQYVNLPSASAVTKNYNGVF